MSAIESPHVKAVSFDCFDTLLFRDVPRPIDLFPRVGKGLVEARILPSWVTPARFQALRIRAEWDARARKAARAGSHEVDIAEIYDAFPVRVMPANRRSEAVAIELATEERALHPFPILVAAAKRARALGKILAVASDTYFQPDWLHDLLIAKTGMMPDLLLCSNAHRKGKGDGLLTVLCQQLAIAPGDILHIGDNYTADVVAAEKAGMMAFHVCHGTSELWQCFDQEHRFAQLDPSEAIDLDEGDLGLQSVRAKCTALAVDTPQAGFWRFGATILGPAMTMFGEWLGARVGAFEADALLCVMREGPFLGRLAQECLSAAGIPVVDVWLSRRVLRYASLVHPDAESLGDLCRHLHSPTLRQVCSDLGVTPDELPPGISPALDDRLDGDAVRTVVERIFCDPTLSKAILARAAAMRQAVVAHLFRQLDEAGGAGTKGEPLRRPLRLALVDAGWQGQIQRMLGDILAAENIAVEIAGFYVGTTQPTGSLALLAQHSEGFLFDFGQPVLPHRQLMRTVEILEQCLSCESGSTISMTADGGPVVAPDLIPFPQRGQIRQIQNGILAFQEMWRASGCSVGDPTAPWIADLVRRPITRALIQPNEAEASMFAAWVHDDNLVDGRADVILPDRARLLARSMSVRQLLHLPSTQVYWNHGLLAQASEQTRAIARVALEGQIAPERFERPLGQVCRLYWSANGAFKNSDQAQVTLVANHEGRSYARLSAHSMAEGGMRLLRFDPLSGPSCLLIEFMELTVQFTKQRPCMRIQLRESDYRGFASNDVWPLGGNRFITGLHPRIHFDLSLYGLSDVASIDLDVGLVVTPLGVGESATTALVPDVLSAGVPVSLAGKPLRSASGAVDAIDGTAEPVGDQQAIVICGSRRPVRIVGWTVDASGAPLFGGAFLMLRRGDGLSFFVSASRTARADVAGALNRQDALFAGMEAVFTPAPLPAGLYTLSWIQVDDKDGSMVETGTSLLVR